MSFGNTLKNFGAIQELLILTLMMVSIFAVFYFEIALAYKIGIMVLMFSTLMLVTLANQILKKQKEDQKASQ